jgi:hypothetical protein
MFAGDGGIWDRQRWNATTDILGAKLPLGMRERCAEKAKLGWADLPACRDDRRRSGISRRAISTCAGGLEPLRTADKTDRSRISKGLADGTLRASVPVDQLHRCTVADANNMISRNEWSLMSAAALS